MKHPVLRDRIGEVINTLAEPDQVRRSKIDPSVLLCYRSMGETRWISGVAKRLNGDGFVITAYIIDAIKEGDTVWQK